MSNNDQGSPNKKVGKPEKEVKAESSKAKALPNPEAEQPSSANRLAASEKEVKAVPIAIGRLKAKGDRQSEVGSPKSEPKQPPTANRPAPAEKEVKAVPIAIGRLKAKGGKQSEVVSPKSERNVKHPPSADRPAPPKLPTENSQLPTEQMEVHHHPDLHHKTKPWKEYLLEGFMIFIAVMLGFIAENIRESITNSQHARELTLQLVQDLKTDTSNLNGIYLAETGIIKNNDTLFDLLQQPLAKADTRKIQKLIADSHSLYLFSPSEGAIGAIKNELHLKQFSNSEILSYVGRYAFHKGLLLTAQEITLKYQRTYLDPFLTAHFTPANLKAAFIRGATPNVQMRNLTQDDLNQLAADMVLIRVNTDELLRHNREAKSDAVNLLQYVNKQYHLGDE